MRKCIRCNKSDALDPPPLRNKLIFRKGRQTTEFRNGRPHKTLRLSKVWSVCVSPFFFQGVCGFFMIFIIRGNVFGVGFWKTLLRCSKVVLLLLLPILAGDSTEYRLYSTYVYAIYHFHKTEWCAYCAIYFLAMYVRVNKIDECRVKVTDQNRSVNWNWTIKIQILN